MRLFSFRKLFVTLYIVPSGSPVAALTPATSKVVDDNLEVPKQEDGFDNQYQMLYVYVFVTTFCFLTVNCLYIMNFPYLDRKIM